MKFFGAACLLLCISVTAERSQTLWRFDQTASIAGQPVIVLGHPQTIQTPWGPALSFDGKKDALLVNFDPVAGAKIWTIEVIFRPDLGGAEKQKVLHLDVQDPITGADTSDRILFEIKIVGSQWCMDSYASTGAQKADLLSCDKLHPLGQWARLTAVYDGATLRNYIGNTLQAQQALRLSAQGTGHTSVAMRISREQYFRGAILEARFTPRALPVRDFLKMPNRKPTKPISEKVR